MNRFLWIVIASSVLILNGCESQEQSKSKTEPHQVVKPEKQTETTEKSKSAIEVTQKVAQKASAQVEQTMQEAEKVVEETTEGVTETAKEAVKSVKETVNTAVVVASEEIAEKVDQVKVAAAPEEITLQASYGNVTFPHGQHAADLECSTCHEGSPVAFDLTKDVAHKLCKGCHKDGGAGPTSCKDCHKK